MAATIDVADINHYQGTSRSLDVAIVDITGAPADLSSVTAIDWQMAPTAYSTPVISKSLSSGITITDEAGGLITIQILPADTEDLDCGWYYHECLVTEAPNRTKVLRGHINLLPDLI